MSKGRDDTVVEYALRCEISSTIVADYHSKHPSKAMQQAKWEEMINLLRHETND